MCLSGLAIKSTNTFVLHVKLTSSLFVYWIDFDKYVSHSGGDKQFCSFEVQEKKFTFQERVVLLVVDFQQAWI